MHGPRPCSRAIATVLLSLAAVVSVTAGKQDQAAAAARGNNVAAVSAAVPLPPSMNISAICQSTPYPSACETALSSPASSSKTDPFAASVQFAMARAATARAVARNASSARRRHRGRGAPPSGVDDCAELLDITVGQLADALAAGGGDDADGVTTWLSAALTNQGTCADSLAAGAAPSDSAPESAVRTRVAALAQFVATALALHVNTHKAAGDESSGKPPVPTSMTFPSWVSQHDRKLLRSTADSVAIDAVVALDGSGTHGSINEAIAAVTAGGGGRKVIHVKAGRYEESVSISSKQKNVMLMGDGKGKTVIVGHKSAADGYTTYATATIAAMGSGFIAKGLTIINSAGPGKGQAVALRVGGDLSVVYQCAIQAYQDTLYVHSNRQFYAEDDIAGTVDFIFGNSAVVIQNCDIQARRPSPGQKDTVTAQGRTDPNQNTGISIHKCKITGAPDLGGTQVYLGRPWQKYSRTVVMETFLDGSISPAGWLEWSGQFALSTLYYGEYGNTGPGSETSKRVTWTGVHTSLSRSDATRFTVANFIMGDSWLGGTGVAYDSGL